MELLLPGVTVYIVEEPPSPTRKNRYTAVAVERDGIPILLHTHRTNAVAEHLIDHGKIPGWKGARVIGREIRVDHSRFDLLVEHRKKEWLIEVKSCTLFGKKTAMFPDAITERGARHLRELAELSDRGWRTAVLFIVHWLKAEFFLPDYHTDLFFAQTFLACRNRVEIIPLAVEWKPDLSLGDRVKRLEIPWELIQREAQDRGSYLLILKLNRKMNLEFGRKEKRQAFPAGYYVYVGSAMKNLTQTAGTPSPAAEKQILAHRLPESGLGFHRRPAGPLLRRPGMSDSRTDAGRRRLGNPRLRRLGLRLSGTPVRDGEGPVEIPGFHRPASVFSNG